MKNTSQDSNYITHLIKFMLPLWFVSWFLAIVVAVSGLFLTALSGVFLVQTAVGLVSLPPILIGFLAVVKIIGRYGELMLSHFGVFGQLKNLRITLFERFMTFGTTQNLASSSLLQHRFSKNVDTLNEFVLRFITPAIVMTVSAIFVACVLIFFRQMLALVFVLLAVIGAIMFIVTTKQYAKQESDLTDKRSTVLQNVMPALTHLIIWQKWANIRQTVLKTAKELDNFDKKIILNSTSVGMAIQWLLAIAICCVIVNTYEQSNPVAMIVCVFVLFGLYEPIMATINSPMSFGRSLIAQDNLISIINTQNQSQNTLPTNFYIHSQNLVIGHLEGIQHKSVADFKVEQGVPLVIMGVSGGGKSTLLQTIKGEIKPIAGDIWLTGSNINKPLRDFDSTDIGFLGQRVDIFNQSLQANLSLGRQLSDDELMMSLHKVNLGHWANSLPQGLNTPLGEYGQAISGGQARRIALARLLLTPKKIFLLDEPFAGLDKSNRDSLWQMLKTHQKHGMLIIASHHALDLTDCQVVHIT